MDANFTLTQNFEHAQVGIFKDYPNIILVECVAEYIPSQEFKNIFEFVEDVVRLNNIDKLIFDKRQLTVFH